MNIDLLIVGTFLIVNLSVGLYYGSGIKTIEEYAIGNRNFSTATLAATITATWISGSFFALRVSDTYKEGLWFVFAGAGDAVALLIIGYFFGPRMKEFFGSISVAEVMGNLYGKNVRLVTAVCSIAQAIGMTALQIKVFSSIFSYFLKFSSITATLISSFVVICYSAFGGIKAVTFTDVIQFFTFGVFIPIFALFVWQVFGDIDAISHTFQNTPKFDYHELLNYENPHFLKYLFLFLYFSIPGVNSTLFQRTLMAKNTKQITQAFTISSVISLFIHLFACFIGIVIFSNDQTLESTEVVMHVVDNYSFTGLKGIALIGIMAMIMSTADSWINTGSVIFAHDFCKPLKIRLESELLASRLFAIFIGFCAVLLALSASDLLKLLLLTANFYKPIVTVPLILAILGFRSTTKAVGIGMLFGGVSAWIWKFKLTPITGIDSVVPAMLINLVTYMGSHYLLGEPGGWTNVKEDQQINQALKKKLNR